MKKFLAAVGAFSVLFGLWYFFMQKKNATADVLIVGTNAEYQPFTFIKDDKIVGFDIDLISEVCKRLGKKIEFRDMPFDVLIPEIQRGSIYIIAAGMTPTTERSKEVFFTECYFTGDPLVIVSNKENPIVSIEQLKDKDVIVNDGYTADAYATALKGPIVKRLPNPASAFLALDAGRGVAYIAAHSTVTPFLKRGEGEKFVATPIPGTEERYAFAISPTKPELLPQINKIIEDLKADGTLKRFKVKWGVE